MIPLDVFVALDTIPQTITGSRRLSGGHGAPRQDWSRSGCAGWGRCAPDWGTTRTTLAGKLTRPVGEHPATPGGLIDSERSFSHGVRAHHLVWARPRPRARVGCIVFEVAPSVGR